MGIQNTALGRPWGKATTDEETTDYYWRRYLEAFPEGEDVLAAVNLWTTYLTDKDWHPLILYRSWVYAARILGLKFNRPYQMRRNKWWRKRPNDCGLELQPDGRYVVANRRRWLQAVSIARQTGRMPLSVLWACLSDPERKPEDPVTRDMLPPLWGRRPEDMRILHPAGGPHIRAEIVQRAKEREERHEVEQRFGGTMEQRFQENSLERFFNEIRLG